MQPKDIKKLLIDLDLTQTAIAEQIGVSLPALQKYLKGTLQKQTRREQIQRIMDQHGAVKGVKVPRLWASRPNRQKRAQTGAAAPVKLSK